MVFTRMVGFVEDQTLLTPSPSPPLQSTQEKYGAQVWAEAEEDAEEESPIDWTLWSDCGASHNSPARKRSETVQDESYLGATYPFRPFRRPALSSLDDVHHHRHHPPISASSSTPLTASLSSRSDRAVDGSASPSIPLSVVPRPRTDCEDRPTRIHVSSASAPATSSSPTTSVTKSKSLSLLRRDDLVKGQSRKVGSESESARSPATLAVSLSPAPPSCIVVTLEGPDPPGDGYNSHSAPHLTRTEAPPPVREPEPTPEPGYAEAPTKAKLSLKDFALWNRKEREERQREETADASRLLNLGGELLIHQHWKHEREHPSERAKMERMDREGGAVSRCARRDVVARHDASSSATATVEGFELVHGRDAGGDSEDVAMEDAPLSESKAEEAAGPSSSDEPSVISVPVVSEPVPASVGLGSVQDRPPSPQ
ncbi:hypothetical protein C8Q76DRAFT_802767 [Earliella scabrosa]|nr:hypothetical protein C8Q76DRAFT_802767 [Earliella scabrosa]